MQIDNQKNTYRIWLRRMLMAIAFTALIILLIFLPIFENPESWFNVYYLIGFLGFVYVVLNIVLSLRVPHFISYSDKGEMLIIRHYPLSMFNSKKYSIEIPKAHFVKYELKTFYFGRLQKLVLYQLFREKIVSYPPISLSALDRRDRDKMLASLDKYVPR